MLRPQPQSKTVAQKLEQQQMQQRNQVVSTSASPWASPQAAPPMTSLAASMQSRQEELRARREKEEQKRSQHQAALVVRKVITQLRKCDPKDFHDLVAELELVQAEHVVAMGEHAEKVREEAEAALQSAMERYEKHEKEKEEKERKEKEAKELREKIAQEKAIKQQEALEQMEVTLLAANQEVDEIEAKVEEAVGHGKVFSDTSASCEAILKAVEEAEATIIATKELQKACVASLKKKREEVGRVKGKEASQATSKLIELQKKLSNLLQPLEELPESIKSAKEVATRKAKVQKQEQDRKDAFAKHDKDGDGKLNRDEVIMFAKTEYGFDLEDAAVDKILGKIPGGKTGVAPERFTQLRSLVSMEKSIAKSRREKAQNEEKERLRKLEEERLTQERDEKKAAIAAAMEEVEKELPAAEELVSNAMELLKKMASIGTEPTPEDNETVEATKESAKTAKAAIDVIEEMLKDSKGEEGEDQLVHKFRSTELRKRQDHVQSLRTQLSKVTTKVKDVQDAIMRRQFAEMEKLRLELLPAMLAFLRSQEKSASECFKANAATGEMSAKEFGALLEHLSGESVPESYRCSKLDDGQVQGLFTHVCPDKETMDEETFVVFMATLYYKVALKTGLSAEMSIESKMMRKLDVGEVLQILEGPLDEAETGLKKVRVKAVQDDKEGWVTSTGNKGSQYLEPVGILYTCVKETNLGEGAEISAKAIRKITKGESAQMLTPEKKDSSGVARMKVRMLKDSRIGWITTTSNKNNVRFFEPC